MCKRLSGSLAVLPCVVQARVLLHVSSFCCAHTQALSVLPSVSSVLHQQVRSLQGPVIV